MERWVESETVFNGRIFTVRTGTVELDDGMRAYREVVDHPGGVCVVPFDGERVTLIRQYRIAVAQEVLEAPAGKIEAGDQPAERARKELLEETGLRADKIVGLGTAFASVGFCTEIIHLFAAMDLAQLEAAPEEEERIETVQFGLEEISRMLRNNEIGDAKTCLALYRLLHFLETQHAQNAQNPIKLI